MKASCFFTVGRPGPPVLLNGSGKTVAEFPFPPAQAGSRWDQYYAQHFDALGDSREEVFVYNGLALWIYQNGAPAPASLPKPTRGPNPRSPTTPRST